MTEQTPAIVEENKAPQSSEGMPQQGSDVLLQLVTFSLVGEEFALPILEVREIIRMIDITPIPNAPSFVEGVINLRGQIIPIVDLRKRFNLETSTSDEARIVVVEMGESILGLIVDSVSEVLRIPADTISPAPAMVSGGIGSEYIRGIAHFQEKMIILIDLRKIFSSREVSALEQAVEEQ